MIITVILSDDIDLTDVEEIVPKSAGGSSEIQEEEADPDSDAIVFG